MKPSLAGHVSNLCRELVQARNDLPEFTARTEEMIGVLKEHLALLQTIERRRANNKSMYVHPHGRENTVH
jgi:hypothetical protein